jgi:hypothetical protein
LGSLSAGDYTFASINGKGFGATFSKLLSNFYQNKVQPLKSQTGVLKQQRTRGQNRPRALM